jgi:electron transport complex protein RnfE
MLSALRELLGRGSLFGHDVFGPKFEPWVFMMMPPGGFLALGIALLVLAFFLDRRKARRTRQAARLAEAA